MQRALGLPTRRPSPKRESKRVTPERSAVVSSPEWGGPTVRLIGLQQTHGNRFVQRFLAHGLLKPESRDSARLWRQTAEETEGTGKEAEKAVAEPTEADKTEFNLLKGKITDTDVKSYIKHRNEFFGSAEAYQTFAAESDKELAENKLEDQVELEGEAQKVFYRWVRKAYHNAGITDVPGLINRGASKELNEALAKVKKAYTKDFKTGGFNPRPKKSAKYQYRLGTISEHALGTAVDIESGKNPILSASDWAFIESLTGKTVDRSLSRWKKEPEALWKDVKALNDLFVSKVASEVERIEGENAAAEAAAATAQPAETQKPDQAQQATKTNTKKAKPKEPIDTVLAGHPDLKSWTQGFFTLEWELVEQLHISGFTWGVTFTSADLHHFEI